jgi:signal peptidase I
MAIGNILKHRKLKRQANECMNLVRHALNMREDLIPKGDVVAAREAISRVQQQIRNKEWDAVSASCPELVEHANAIRGRKPRGALVENVEMLIVAIAVAMGLRAYFLQPFKIPTGSMQPTLNGITAEAVAPDWTDKLPFKVLRLVVSGEWYHTEIAKASGVLSTYQEHPTDPSAFLLRIGGVAHKIPKDIYVTPEGNIAPNYYPGRLIKKGDVLWAGRTQRGDHLFVNKVIWNFRKPKRDEVMVFTTDGIHSLPPGTHYIKRMVGLPSEKVSIRPPNLVINGKPMVGLYGIDKVTSAINGDSGYQLAEDSFMNAPHLEWRLNPDQYFALGDNTTNSRDSRYWGPVPAENLVGPAVFVYWPFTKRWGLIR